MPQQISLGRRAVVLARAVGNDAAGAGLGAKIERLEERRMLSTTPAIVSSVPTSEISPIANYANTVVEGTNTLSTSVTPAATLTVTGTNGGDATAPTPVITVLGATGSAPHSVFVHAIDSKLGAGTVLTARYQWDFGDPGSEYDSLVGWDAAHTYDKPGTYTITLTLTNQLNKTRILQTNVTIAPAKYTRTIYVDSVAGNDKNNGSSPTSAIQSIAEVLKLTNSNTQVLFKAGESFNVYTSMNLPYQNLLLGSYGTGAQPVLMRQAGVGTSIIGMFDNSANVIIQDLTFNSPYLPQGNYAGKVNANGIFPAGVNITIRRDTFLNLTDAINDSRNPQGTIVQDCTAPLTTGLRGCFVWGQGTDQVYLGNYVANSTREHNIRTVWTVRQLIAYNNLTNLDRSTVDPQDYNKGTIDIHRGTYAYVANNWVYGGELRVGPRNGPAAVAGDTTQWCVVEGNHTFGHEVQVYPGTYHVMFRNNVFTEDNDCCISIVPNNPAGDNIQDISFVNNTGVTNSIGGEFINITSGGNAGTISLINNLWLAPNIVPGMHASAAIFIKDSSDKVLGISADNVWPMPKTFNAYASGGINYVWTSWAPPHGYYTPKAWDAQSFVQGDDFAATVVSANYTPAVGSVAATAGVQAYGIFVDINGKPRPSSGHITAGALQT